MVRAPHRWIMLMIVLMGGPVVPTVLQGAQDEAGALDRGIEAGELLHQQFRPLEALEVFEAILETSDTAYAALWRASREAVSLGMLAGTDEDARHWYSRAEAFARRAVDIEPDGTDGNEWLAIALGRRALQEGPRTRVRMAEEIRVVALRILALEPDNAGGLHVLGQWNAEIMRLRGVTRLMARRLLGGDSFDQASWDQARTLLEAAVEQAPRRLVHHLELGRVYLDLGMDDEGRASLREVMDRPALDPVDPLLKQQAMELLRSL